MEYTKLKDGVLFGQLKNMIEVVVIPEGYENIDHEVFAGIYPNLKKIICPSTLKEAGYRCFSCCNSVKEIILNDGLEIIGSEAFQGATSIETITIPNSVEFIGENAFRGCTNLKSINIDKTEGYIAGAPWGAPESTEVIWGV